MICLLILDLQFKLFGPKKGMDKKEESYYRYSMGNIVFREFHIQKSVRDHSQRTSELRGGRDFGELIRVNSDIA